MGSTPAFLAFPHPLLLPRLSRYSRAAEQLSNFLGGLSPAFFLPLQVGAIAISRRHQQQLQLVRVQLGGQRRFQGRALQPSSEDLGIGPGLPTPWGCSKGRSSQPGLWPVRRAPVCAPVGRGLGF